MKLQIKCLVGLVLVAVIALAIPPIIVMPPMPQGANSPQVTWYSNMFNNAVGNLRLGVELPTACTNFSVTFWTSQNYKAGVSRIHAYGDVTTSVFYSLDDCKREVAPFLTETGTTSRTLSNVLPASRDWSSDQASKTIFTNCVFAVAFTSAVPATLTVANKTFVTNRFNGNVAGKVNQRDVSVATTGGAWKLEIAERPVVRFYQRINGVQDHLVATQFSDATIITNEMVFVAMQVKLEGTNHLYRCSMLHWDGDTPQGVTSHFDYPPKVSVGKETIFQVGTSGSAWTASSNTAWRVWNLTVRKAWLTDDELILIRNVERETMDRFGIPRWHTP